MNEQVIRTLVKERLFLREGRDIEQLIAQQAKVRPYIGLICVCQSNGTLPQNMRLSQAVANNSGKDVLPVQFFHEQSQSIVIALFTDVIDAWLRKYMAITATQNNQPGYVFIDPQGVNFYPTNGTPSNIAESYSGTLDEIERFSNWLVPEFVVDGYVDNSMSFKQQMDQKYL